MFFLNHKTFVKYRMISCKTDLNIKIICLMISKVNTIIRDIVCKDKLLACGFIWFFYFNEVKTVLMCFILLDLEHLLAFRRSSVWGIWGGPWWCGDDACNSPRICSEFSTAFIRVSASGYELPDKKAKSI